ncbi:MAG TPA: DUF4262 domain-containing protein [Ilumatobacter sp.]|nr:DUF4262 domain-containing protein [Ilumatobacter sp.]
MSNKPHHRPPRHRHRYKPPPFRVFAIDTGVCTRPGCDCGFTGRPWSYTAGRSRRGQAELVTTGLFNPEVIAHLTHDVAHQIDAHDLLVSLPPDRVVDVLGLPFRLDVVPPEWVLHDPSRITSWFSLYGRAAASVDPPDILQIVWPDEFGRFPDDPLCGELERQRQVLLAVDPVSYPTVGNGLGLAG